MNVVIQFIVGLILSFYVCVECVDRDVFGLKYLDTSIDPCDNFYNFACGNFDKYYQRDDDQPVLDMFALAEDELVLKGKEILSNPIQRHEPEAIKKAKTAYTACVNEDLMHWTRTPERKIIDEFGGFPLSDPNAPTSPLTWTQIGEITRKFGIHHFFHFSIEKFDPNNYFLLMQPDAWEDPTMIRPKYVQNYDDILEEQFKKAAGKRKSYGRKMAVDETVDSFDILLRSLSERLTKTMANKATLDLDLTHSIAKDLQDVRNFMSLLFSGGLIGDNDTIIPMENFLTLAQLQEWTDQQFGNTTDMNWREYLDEVFKWSDYDNYKEDDFLIYFYTTEAIYGVLNLIRQTDPKIVKNFVLLRTLIFLAPDSGTEGRNEFEEYYKANGLKYYDRWEYCTRKILDVVDTPGLSFATAYEFARHYFNANKIPEVVRLINNLRKSYNQSFESHNWIDDDDRELLKEKISNTIMSLGYPNISNDREALDTFYENLEICQGDNYGNSQRIRAFRQAYSFNEYGDNFFWGFSPFEVNARYVRGVNRIKLPFAMLQDGFFRGNNPIYDYSRLGTTLAHEIGHALDSLGIGYDQNGFPSDTWLSNSTFDNFFDKTKCLIDQQSKYYIPELSKYVDGEQTLNENIADTSGVSRSFAAFKNLHPPPPVPAGVNYTKEQLFFISYATMWCSQASVDYLASVTTYPPTSYRVIGTLSNSEDFSKAFSCPVGSNMNPERKCTVW